MSRRLILSILFIIALTFMVSCSGGDGDLMTTPAPTDRDVVSTPTPGTTSFGGLWQVVLDPATGTGDIVQLRSADKIINVLGFMEPPPLTLMDLDWDNLVIDVPPGTAEVGVILNHPIAGDAVFNGFDVRGVCFGPKVTNADGLTIIPSPEFFSGVPFGYQDGLLGVPDSTGNFEGLAGYKYFCDDLGAVEDLATFFNDTGNLANRGLFSSGETNQRDYLLDWNGTGYDLLVFNYAIYANYDWPVGDPPITLDSFEITTANSAEAFCADFTETASSFYYTTSGSGGAISLQVELWDWQGDISLVTIESLEPGIMAQAAYDVALGAFPGGKSYGFEFDNVPATPTSVGDLDLLITVTDAKTFGEHWFLDLLPSSNSMFGENIYNCFIYTATVVDCPPCTLTSINPDKGGIGDALTGVAVTGADILDGSLLGVTLKMAGESDIVATNAVWVSSTQITCDISIPDNEDLEGLWDVYLINGCGTPSNPLVGGFEVTILYSEDFSTDPGSDWYTSNYQYWSGCTQGTPDWRSTAPYGVAAGSLQTSGTPTWGTLAGGGISTMVSPPFECPTASTVIFRCRVMWDLGGSYSSYCKTRFLIGNGSSPGLSPFSTTGAQGSNTILLRNTAHGSANPGIWTTAGYAYMTGAGWQGNFNNWPTNITNYVDVTIPPAYHGDTNVKIAFQCCPDWCGYPGTLTGIVLDDVEILTF